MGRFRRSRTSLVVLMLVSALSLERAPSVDAFVHALTRFPYLTDVVEEFATVNWATDRSADTGFVRWGEAGVEPCTAHATPATRTSITVGSSSQYQWKAMLTLKPDTEYCYRVYLGDDPVDLLGSDPSPQFVTQLPGGSTKPFSFAVFGDWGKASSGGNVHQANLMRLIDASGARFAVTTGDIAYPSGDQHHYGDLYQTGTDRGAVFGPDFWAVPGDELPLFETIGNHGRKDTLLVNWPQTMAASTSGGRYEMETYCCLNGTSSKSYPSAWYAFDAGAARFYVLDASWTRDNVGSADLYENDFDYHWTPTSDQYRWLENDLATHPSAVKFAFLHFPLHSDQSAQDSDTFLQGSDSVEGLLDRYGVDIAFNGHAHIYQRNTPAVGSLVSYVTGGGGAQVASIGGNGCSPGNAYGIGFSPTSKSGSACGSAPVPEAPERVYHFLLVKVDGTTVTVTPTDSRGRTFDVVTYDFDGEAPPPPPPPLPPPPPEDSFSFSPMGDATIESASPTRNLGGDDRLEVDGSPVKKFLMKFSVDTVGCEVTSARIRLYNRNESNAGGSFHRVADTSWNEGTVTWSNSPTADATALAILGSVSSGNFYEADVTPAVTGAGPVSFMVSSPAANGADYSSKEGSQPPRLTVECGTGDPPPPPPPPGASFRFVAVGDATVQSAAPSRNLGGDHELKVDGSPVSKFLMKFSVDTTGCEVSSARIRLYNRNESNAGGSFYPVGDTSWSEATVTWSNAPTAGAIPLASLGRVTSGNFYEADVTPAVTGDGDVSFMVSSTASNGADYSSKEGSQPPQLIVECSSA